MKDGSIKDLLKHLDNRPQRKKNDHVLLIDALNMFIRGFTMVKTLNNRGQHTGGILGFLRSLGFIIRTHNPTRVVCVFDGKGSSVNRKNINPEYKSQRGHTRITNWEAYDTLAEEKDSMESQISRLYDYLETLPIDVITLPKVEADDVISYVAQGMAHNGKRATIVSSDKDYLQIIKKGIQVYRPIEKKLYNHTNIHKMLELLPENYLISKALLGDNSDNLEGVKGLGLKTLLKEFPEIKENPNLTLQDIYNKCEEKLEGKIIFSKIIDSWDKVEQNYKLMNLDTPRLSDKEKDFVVDELLNSKVDLKINTFLYYLDQDGIEGITRNTEGWLTEFKYLSLF